MSDETPTPTDLLKLLLDETRLAIAGLCAVAPASTEELASQVPVKRGDLERQVSQLIAAGLLARDGEKIRLDVDTIRAMKRSLFARPSIPDPASPEEKVIVTFVRDGRIVRLPVQHAKRIMVLRWLADQFEPGRDYREPEVNEVLAGHGEDYATLRRFLVDAGLVTRRDGVYRRATSAAGPID